MANAWALSALWVGLALAATLLAIWFRVATALSEIIVGTVAQLVIGAFLGTGGLLGSTQWITYLAGTGAIVLTFLAGAELEPTIFKTKWREALLVGMAGFFGPFLGCTLVGHLVLGWSMRSSWLCGVALSTTSVAVVYAVMLELGFNVTDFGKSILAACFINDLGTVIALGLIFSPFTVKTLIFVGTCAVLFVFLPALTRWFFKKYGGRVSELETKVHPLSPLRAGWTGGMGRQRSRASGLHDWLSAGGNRGQGPRAGSPPENAHLRPAYSFLLHSRRPLC